MRIGVTEIKRPSRSISEVEPVVKESTGSSLSKKSVSRNPKGKRVKT